MFADAVMLPVKVCVSSVESPKVVEPDNVAIVILVTEEDIMYSLAVKEPEIITSLPLKEMGSKLPVPSAKLVLSVWTTL
jgi:hypothetical protein